MPLLKRYIIAIFKVETFVNSLISVALATPFLLILDNTLEMKISNGIIFITLSSILYPPLFYCTSKIDATENKLNDAFYENSSTILFITYQLGYTILFVIFAWISGISKYFSMTTIMLFIGAPVTISSFLHRLKIRYDRSRTLTPDRSNDAD